MIAQQDLEKKFSTTDPIFALLLSILCSPAEENCFLAL